MEGARRIEVESNPERMRMRMEIPRAGSSRWGAGGWSWKDEGEDGDPEGRIRQVGRGGRMELEGAQER